ncbi:MAG: alginate lyase family protein, partial [Akkermansiaceae bacterium]|nr:alginate lyase family protein [Verrucomicrobiales bacterium]
MKKQPRASRSQRMRLSFAICAIASLIAIPATLNAAFVHPGILHTKADLDRMKTNVLYQTYPWYGAFQAFQLDSKSSSSYVAAPANIGAGGYQRVRADAHAAYQNAIMWYITGNSAHAAKAREILDGWATTCTSWICTANIDAYAAALHFCAAAEILRHTPSSGWSTTSINNFSSFVANIMWPVLHGTLLGTGTGGCSSIPGDGNQGVGDARGLMAIAIFLSDQGKFDLTVNAYLGNASSVNTCVALTKEAGGYIDSNGCPGEAGRDQAHPQGGMASYMEMAQMAWCQGLDLWAHGNNRLLAAAEWCARFNLGDNGAPYSNQGTCFSTYGNNPSQNARGQWTMTYEIAYNHYVVRRGLSMPWTLQALNRLRPEGTAGDDPG